MELNSIKSVLEETAEPESEYNRWNSEITYATQELAMWHKQASQAGLRYMNKMSNAYDQSSLKMGYTNNNYTRFNLFGANVDVLQAALYATPPEVCVSRKFNDTDDDLARIGGNIVQRILQDDMSDYDGNFSALCASVVQDRLVAGLGTGWLRIELVEEAGVVMGQKVCIDYVNWHDLLWSPCKTWETRRWVARRVFMTYDAGVKRFGEVFKNIPLDRQENKDETGYVRNRLVQEAEIYEIWDREKKEVLWLSLAYPHILNKKVDFLQLDNFEPTAKPFFALVTTTACIPTPDYIRWLDQYAELDNVNARIAMLTKACRAAGVYDKAQTGVKRLMQEGADNELIPVDNWAMFAEKGGLKGTIDWLPLEVIVAAQSTLREAREDIKQQIYELTGISDVVRGSSNPHETLGAQKMKADFASSRIQVLQGAFEAWVCATLKMKAELMVRHFPPEALIEMSNILNTPDAGLAMQAVTELKSNNFMDYRLQIEPFSMAQIDFAQEKSDRVEFLTVMGGFLEKTVQAAQTVPDLVPLMATMLKFGISGFRIASTIEGEIDKQLDLMQKKAQEAAANPQATPNPEQIKAEAETQKMQFQAQLESAKYEAMKQTDERKALFDAQKMQIDIEMARVEHEFALELQAAKHEQAMQLQAAKTETDMMNAQQDQMLEQMKIEGQIQVSALNAVDNVQTTAANAKENEAQRTHERESAREDRMEGGEDDD